MTAVAALLQASLFAGCDVTEGASESVESPPSNAAETAGTTSDANVANALAQLENIPVKGRAPKTGYTRDAFGPAWADNGCDTRNDILARDLVDETFKAGTNNCAVATGVLADKYTGATINFVRGQDTAAQR